MSSSAMFISSVFFGIAAAGAAWLVLPVLVSPSLWQWLGRNLPLLRSLNGRREALFGLCRWLRPWVAPAVRPSQALRGRLHLLGFPPDFDEACWMALRICCGCLIPVIGLFIPDLWMRGQVTRERDKAQRGFPAVLDGLALSLEAGQSFVQAMRLTAQRAVDGPSDKWRRSLWVFAAELRAGGSKAAAVSRLQNALPLPVVQQFGALVLVADQAGLSMGKILRAQSSQARRLYQLQIEERAMKAPVKLMGPLVCCIFPCTFIVLLAPLLIKLSESFGVGV